jgi:preprotein translocase subunit SecF
VSDTDTDTRSAASTPTTVTEIDGRKTIGGIPLAHSGVGRLLEGQTAVDFVGRRKFGLVASGFLIVITVASLLLQGLNLGIDFTGGVSWDVPSENGFDADDAVDVLDAAGISTEGTRIQARSSDAGDFIKVQVGDQPEAVGTQLRQEFADSAGVDLESVDVNLVSSSWGSEVTGKAVRALVIFLALVAVYISFRFEWRMALASIVAMLHDVLISVGIYSLFQFIVTPPTVIAFLTILGYSLYDTIVVFDRIKENESRFGTTKPPYADVLNVSMNQVLMRSLNTTISSIVPVISLLFIGSFLLGQGTLAEFAIALLVGMATGTYSSIFVAVPLLYVLKNSDANWAGSRNAVHITGDPLREMVVSGNMSGRRARGRAALAAQTADAVVPSLTGVDAAGQAKVALSHPPRPRKKTRR